MVLRKHLRILFPASGASLLLLLIGGLSAFYLHQQQQDSSSLLANSMTKIQAADDILVFNEKIVTAVSEYMLSGDMAHRNAILKLQEETREPLQQIEELANSDEERRLIAGIRSGNRSLLAEIESLFDQPQKNLGSDLIIDELRLLSDKSVVEPVKAYRGFNLRQIKEASTNSDALADKLGMVLFLLGSCGCVAGLLIGLAVSQSVHRQMEERERAMMESEKLATLGRLAAGLAHELRNPLTAMKIVVQSAEANGRGYVLDPDDFLVLDEEIDRLNNSIQAFLDFAKPPRPDKRHCLACSIVEQTVALVSRRANELGVKIQVCIPDDSSLLEVDPAQLRQVVLNLLLNAIDAAGEGGQVCVRMRQGVGSSASEIPVDTGENRTVIEVEDSGAGLPEQLGDRIFDPFVSTKENGTGLGLAICRHLVDVNGGQLTARNGAKGAVFSIILPADIPVAPRGEVA